LLKTAAIVRRRVPTFQMPRDLPTSWTIRRKLDLVYKHRVASVTDTISEDGCIKARAESEPTIVVRAYAIICVRGKRASCGKSGRESPETIKLSGQTHVVIPELRTRIAVYERSKMIVGSFRVLLTLRCRALVATSRANRHSGAKVPTSPDSRPANDSSGS
jgi:hypothetical protein